MVLTKAQKKKVLADKDKARKARQHEKLVREREERHARGRARDIEKAEARKQPGFVSEGERLTQLAKEQEAAREKKQAPIILKPKKEPIRLGKQPKKETPGLLKALVSRKAFEERQIALTGKPFPEVRTGIVPITPVGGVVGGLFGAEQVKALESQAFVSRVGARLAAEGPRVGATTGGITGFPEAQGFVTNTKSIGLTTSWITRLGKAVKSPAFVIPAIVTAIGSYPFAGFIKEEALQTLSFASKTAQDQGDIGGMEDAIREQEEILNPTIWDQILGAIPFANVLSKLKDFFTAARTKLNQDKNFLENAREKAEEEPEETFEERVTRIREEGREIELEEREEDEKYWQGIADDREEAREQERDDEKKFWDNLFEERRKNQERERAADDAYWEEIYAKNAKRKTDEREADEAYWAEIKRKNTGVGLTTEDKKVISDWNAGKSALNFKWLGR